MKSLSGLCMSSGVSCARGKGRGAGSDGVAASLGSTGASRRRLLLFLRVVGSNSTISMYSACGNVPAIARAAITRSPVMRDARVAKLARILTMNESTVSNIYKF